MHKFRSIKIKAFRVYNFEQTFDFTYGDDIANLVVIYAPNGYGKTSFSDAVEWGFTGEISRIQKNRVLLDTANYEKGEILKNKESIEECGTITFQADDNNELIRTTAKLDGRTKKDYQEGEYYYKGDTFKQLDVRFGKRNILAHEQIDSFLKAVTPEERYDELIPFWDEDNVAKVHKGIISDFKEITKRVEKETKIKTNIEKELAEYRVNMSEYDQLNKLITELNKIAATNYISLSKDTSSNQINWFINQINEQYSKVKINKENCINRSSTTKILIINFNTYLNNIAKYKNTNDNIVEINNMILNLEKLDEDKKMYITIMKTIDALKYDMNKYNYLVSNNKHYWTLRSDISSHQEKIINHNKEIENILELSKKIKLSIADYNNELIKEKQRLNNEREFNNSIDMKISEYILSEKKLNHYEKRIEKINLVINMRLLTRNKLEKEKEISTYYLLSDKKTILETMTDKSNAYYVYEIEDLSNDYKKLKNLETEIQSKEVLYQSMGKLEDNLNTIVKVGELYVEEAKVAICPLCKQKYNDHSELLKHIQSNFEDMIDCQKIKNDIMKLKQNKETVESLVEEQYNVFINMERSSCNEIDKKIQILNKKIIAANNLKATMDHKHQYFKTKKIGIFTEFENKKIHEFLIRQDYEGLHQQNTYIIEEIEAKINDLEDKIKKEIDYDVNLSKENIFHKTEVQKFQIYIDSKKQDSIFQEYNSLLQEMKVDNDLDKIELKLTEIKKKIDEEIENEKCIDLEIEVLEKKCSLYDREKIHNEKIIYETELRKSEQEIQNYEEKYYDLFSSEEKEDISLEKINIEKKQVEEQLQYNLELEHIINKVLTMKSLLDRNILIKKKEEEINNCEDNLADLNVIYQEIQKVYSFSQSYIRNKISSVFSSEVINEIYERIEPHPQLTEIEFEPNFDDDKPKIHIYTKGDQSEKSAPVLYLSSAQLNILSLSIFYARALQNSVTHFKTIFMDDPVENFDDMNILSFIDLVRTITVQLDMQIIMSTHDERLFNLMKRKMPEKYYKSRFIELESYGVIKKKK